MLVSLLGVYCLLTTFMVCEHWDSRFGVSGPLLISIVAASHQYYCLAKQLLINHAPNNEEHLTVPHDLSSFELTTSYQQKAPLNLVSQQSETNDLLRRACAVAESHTNTMGIVLMSTLPILACEYRPRLCVEYRHLRPC